MKLILLLILSISLSISAQFSNLDSLKLVLETSVSDSAKLRNLYWINRYHRQNDSLDKALEVAYKMLNLAEAKEDQKNITWSKRIIAYNLNLLGRREESLKLTTDYIASLETKDTADVATLYHDLGRECNRQENYSEALKYFFEAAKFYELMGNQLAILKDISSAYSRLNDEVNASKYNQKLIEIAAKNKDTLALASAYINEGYYNLMMIKHDISYSYTKKAQHIYENELNTPKSNSLFAVYSNIADVYIYYYKNAPDSILIVNPSFGQLKDIKQGMLDTARHYIDKAYEIGKYHNRNLLYVYYGYGDLYYYQGKIKESEKEFLKSYELSLSNSGRIFDRKKVSEQLYKIYKKLGEREKALKFYEEFVALRDTLFNQDKQREVGKQEAKFEFAKEKAVEEAERAKQKVIDDAKLAQEKAVAKEQEKNQKIVTYSILLGLIIISVFTLLIFKRLKVARAQQVLIENQKITIEKNRNQMLESIEYSKNIQQRIFPTLQKVKSLLPNSFLYFRPKDVVSGDFYWVHHKGNKTYFSVADCTGHGVPGAFMTLISLNLINAIILEDDINTTSDILERLHVRLKERLTSSEEEQMKHGLDIAMCAYNHDTNQLEYSGLHNPLYIVNKENILKEVKGDNLFLGISSNFKVTKHIIDIQPGDSIYMSTDGFPDQKGGEKGKKFYYSRLRNTLRIVDKKPLEARERALDQKFIDWKGELEQIDDVCIMGVSF
jgi:serine phosphatase RsbU (regulator of sigma subunit)